MNGTLTDTTLQVRVEIGVIVMKGYSTFPKAPKLEPNHKIVYCHILDMTVNYLMVRFQFRKRWGFSSDPSAKIQLAYFTVPANWAGIKPAF